MLLSLGPFITCSIVVICLIIYFNIILHLGIKFPYFGKRIVFIGILLVFLRIAIPLNVPFSYTLYSANILPRIVGGLYQEVFHGGFLFIDIIYLIWIAGTTIQLFRLILNSIRFNKYIRLFNISKESQNAFLYEIVQKHTEKPVNIAILPFSISPSITGLFRSTILLPNIEAFSYHDLDDIFTHEIMHFKKHDLWILLMMDITCCVHWWNPLIYLMKRMYTLIIEISNDQKILETKNYINRIEYAELILRTARMANPKDIGKNIPILLPFVNKNKKVSNLHIRIKYIFTNKRTKFVNIYLQFCNIIICGMIFFSFVFVLEPTFPVSDEDLDCVSITPENAYFVKVNNTYELFVDGVFLISLDALPESLEDIPIYIEEVFC